MAENLVTIQQCQPEHADDHPKRSHENSLVDLICYKITIKSILLYIPQLVLSGEYIPRGIIITTLDMGRKIRQRADTVKDHDLYLSR